jgi:hypothetical protein
VLVDWHDLNEKKPAFKFPGVAADILSTPNQRVIDFFSTEKGGVPFGHVEPLIDFFIDSHRNGAAKYNHTRSGYVCKVLNGLVLHRTGLIAKHLLVDTDLSTLVEACHCRSASMTVLNLITLLTSSVQTPMMMAAPASLLEKQGDSAVSIIAPEIVEGTLVHRKDLFKMVLTRALETADDEAYSELHANLVWIVSQLLIKHSVEKSFFVKIFNSLLPQVVEVFIQSFTSPINNRLGNLFLVALETQAKDLLTSQTTGTPPSQYCLPYLAVHIKALAKAIVEAADQNKTVFKDSRMTHTFSLEMGRVNPKVYKVLEALNVSMRLYVTDHEFVQAVAGESGLRRHIFSFFTSNPFNNILHNLAKKFIILLIEKAPVEIVDLYFANNPAFIAFIDHVSNSPFASSAGPRKVRQGYIGQVVVVGAALKEHQTPGNAKLFESLLIRPQLEAILV